MLMNNEWKFCETFTKCFLLFAFYGLRYDSGITSINPDTNDSNVINIIDKGLSSRLLLDLLFHLFVKFGIILFIASIFIVSYLNFVKSNKKNEFDKENICFICNINRDNFLRNKICFKKHISKIHNKMDYIYYIIFLVTRKRNNLSRLDKFILEKFIIGEFYWMPCKDTISLQESFKEIKKGDKNISLNNY